MASLRGENALLDLDIVCQERHIRVHKVLLASASKFFKDQLCQANVLVPVLIRLEDFGLDLHFEAVSSVIEFVYRGQVVIPGQRLTHVCQAAHGLGIHGLVDFLPQTSDKVDEDEDGPQQSLHPAQTLTPRLNGQSAGAGVGGAEGVACANIESQNVLYSTGLESSEPHNGPFRSTLEDGSGAYSGGNWLNGQAVQSPTSLVDHSNVNPNGGGSFYSGSSQLLDSQPYSHHSQYGNTPMCSSQFDEQYIEHENHHPSSHPEGHQEDTVYQYNHPSLGEPVSEMILEDTFNPLVGSQPDEAQLDPNPGDLIELSLAPKKVKPNDQDAESGPVDFPMPKTPQGKLRVIAQSMLNASENIQTPSRVQESHRLRVLEKIPLPESGSASNLENDTGSVASSSVPSAASLSTTTTKANSTVIQTPLNANQVAWLTSQCSSTAVSGPTTSEEEAVDRVEVPGGTWILTNPKTGGEGAWTVPADDPQPKPPSTGEVDKSSNPGNWHLLTNFSHDSTQAPPEESESKKLGDQMLAIRSGIPLALQTKKRKRTKDDPPECENSISTTKMPASPVSSSKKGDLGIRKDLTLPSAPKPGEDNVFQSEDQTRDSNALQFPVVQLEEDEDCELTIRGIAESGQSGLIRTATTSEEYQCVECSMGFPKAAQLRRHVKSLHKEKDQFMCPVCKMGAILGKEDLKVHLYKEHGIGEMFRCEECDFECLVKSQYISHVSLHSFKDDKLKCIKCEKEFKSRNGFKLHLKQHFQEKLFQCSYCSEFTCAQKLSLIRHLATKHKKDLMGNDLQEIHTCSECDFKSVADYQLKDHILRKHTSKDKMRFHCQHCDYASVEKAAVDRHVRFKHTNDRPYECEICGFRTHTTAAMARHKRGHYSQKPFVCNICGKAYADSKRLRDHKFRHEGKFPFVCQLCGFCTRRKDSLNNHMQRQHKSEKVDPDPGVGQDSFESHHEGKPARVKANSRSRQNTGGVPKSHIVGHINQDGSIRPICNDPGVGQDSFESHHEGKPARVKANSRSRHESGGVPKSHIVGHINQDGSIRPICNVGEDEQNIQTSPMPVVNADEVIVISQNSSSSIGLANELTIRDEGGTNRADESGSEIAEEG
eukprot:TCALIF_07508-PA protein Name:"Similar to Zfp26 Zinc finger protein 26 (Mus musculus)" AED:0.37 eAED:0.37 QI:0/0/0/0.37/1/1/8/0/1106